MKLSEALSIVGSVPADTPEFPVLLACGFTPLHLQSYLAAHLQQAVHNRRVQIATGLYGDLAGTLENLGEAGAHACAVVVEWADLDARLGYRKLGGWGQRVVASTLESAEAMLQRIEAAIRALPRSFPVALSLPSLPLPPGFHTTAWQASPAEVALEEAVANFAKRISGRPSIRIVNRQRLDAVSAPQARYDLRSDIHTGFPYTLAHADALGSALAALLQPPQPKKGLITDLDDTLWLGLVGEDGHESLTWEATTKGHLHGLFQQMLHALADHGVLLAIASKNGPGIAAKALDRPDLLIPREKIFPVEVHWEPKSESVARILRVWNVDAASVVFVDDSPMELEEVRAAHPGIECLLFPKADYVQGLAFLERLRDLFGKAHLSEEDSLRQESIRQAPQLDTGASADSFLQRAEAVVTMHYDPPASDARVVELVNKTNQFNLNGIRYTEAEWQEALRQPRSFCAAVSYRDKFGPLGKIAVIRGKEEGKRLAIGTWVMSCRAFSRRIEYQSLFQIFRKFSPGEIVFEYRATGKNAPIQAFLTQVLEQPPAPDIRLTFDQFEARRPKLYHKVVENE